MALDQPDAAYLTAIATGSSTSSTAGAPATNVYLSTVYTHERGGGWSSNVLTEGRTLARRLWPNYARPVDGCVPLYVSATKPRGGAGSVWDPEAGRPARAPARCRSSAASTSRCDVGADGGEGRAPPTSTRRLPSSSCQRRGPLPADTDRRECGAADRFRLQLPHRPHDRQRAGRRVQSAGPPDPRLVLGT